MLLYSKSILLDSLQLFHILLPFPNNSYHRFAILPTITTVVLPMITILPIVPTITTNPTITPIPAILTILLLCALHQYDSDNELHQTTTYSTTTPK